MTKKLTFFLALSCFGNFYGQQKKIYPEFYGKWINTQYEYTLKYDTNKNGLSNITPQYLMIDSFGLCTIISRFEQKAIAGKPYKEKVYGKIEVLTYKHYGEMYLTQVKNNDHLIALSSLNNGLSILFRKVN